VDWVPGDDEGDAMASSADCIRAVWVNVMVGCVEGAVKLGASVYR
jgi:hypothetical protein